MTKQKKRLDSLVVDNGFIKNRTRAKALIMAGKVLVNNQKIDKPGMKFSIDEKIQLIKNDHPYVSRGGLKLESALAYFKLDVSNFICLDIGASTGGFTDCLLKHGAKRVYAIDVGYGQLAWDLRNDPRVEIFERTNIRHLSVDSIHEQADLATIDVSFISLKIIIPVILKFIKKKARILALIKPQFEVGKNKVGKGGIVRDPVLHELVKKDMKDFIKKAGLTPKDIIPSPILGQKGNKEFFVLLNS